MEHKDGLLEMLDALIARARENNLQIRALLINQDLYMAFGSLLEDYQPNKRALIQRYCGVPVWPDANTEHVGIVAHNIQCTTPEVEFAAIQIEAVALLEKLAGLEVCPESAAQARLVLDALRGIRARGEEE